MAQKLLKARKRKIAAGRAASMRPPFAPNGRVRAPRESQGIVLVGTYREKQLAWIKENGVYNYPVKEGDEFDTESFTRIRELWLYADAKARRHCFTAEFVGKMTREEFLTAYPTYVQLGRGRSPSAPNGRARAPGEPHEAYYIFRTSFLDYGPKLDAPGVLIRAMDFATGRGRTKSVRKAYDQYKADGEFAPLARYLPTELSQMPRERLRVCEAAVQLDFLTALDLETTSAIRRKSLGDRDGRLTCLDFFAGSGLVSEGLSKEFQTVWANDISQKKALVFNANNADGILQVCPIENVAGVALPSVDLSWGSFPCQDLSLAGDIGGIYASRSGLFWQWLRVMDEMKTMPPVVVAENVVGLVSAEGGRYYVVAHEELSNRAYRVGAVMLDALHWVPQSRKRIFVIGVRSDIDLTGLVASTPTWCHPNPVIRVASLVKDWVWWKIPEPKVHQAELDGIVDFQSPCDDAVESANKLALIPPAKLDELRRLSQGCRRAFTGYRRTRNHKQVLEVRTDGVAGCLRTPCGGSSRQIVLIADHGKLSTRLLTVRETARLMGAPDSYRIPGSYNDGYMAMGDAVAVPVVRFLSEQLLAPLAMRTKVTK